MKRFALCLLGVFVFLLGVQWVLASASYRGAPLSVGAWPVLAPIGLFAAVALSMWVSVRTAGTVGARRRVAATALGCVFAFMAWAVYFFGSIRLLGGAYAGDRGVAVLEFMQKWFAQWALVTVLVVCSGYAAAWVVGGFRLASAPAERAA